MKIVRSSAILLFFLLAACGREEIAVYSIPKEESPKMPAMAAANSSHEVTWTAPGDWKEQPSTEMRQGSFLVNGANGTKADISVIGFPGDAGGDLANVNRWRGQINLPALDDAGLQGTLQKTDMNGESAGLFELNEKSDGSGRMIIAAILHRDDKTWFFKIMGDAGIVSAQKNGFLGFLKSVRFPSAETAETSASPMAASQMPMMSSSAMPPVANAPKPSWKVPAGWQEQQAGGMRQGSFAIVEGTAKADVSVVALTGDAGGALANINRWRGQISLPEISEADLAAQTSKVALGDSDVIVVDIAGEMLESSGAKSHARILAAIISHGGNTWFVKVTGDDALVEKHKPEFLDFVKSFQFPPHA